MLKVALLQLRATPGDQDANLEEGDAGCRRAKALGADIALFPVGCSSTKSAEGDRKRVFPASPPVVLARP